MRYLILLVLAVFVSGCETPGVGLGIQDFDEILDRNNNVVCLDDGFDKRCILVIDGEDGKDGKDAKDGKDGLPGLPGRDGKTTVVHVTEFRFIDVPVPASEVMPQPIPEPIPEPQPLPEPIPEPNRNRNRNPYLNPHLNRNRR